MRRNDSRCNDSGSLVMLRIGLPVTCRPYETRRGLGWAWRSCPALMVSPPSALPFVATLWLPHSAPNAAAATTDLLVGIGYGRQHFLYFFPLPHGHGSLRPTLADRGDARVFCWTTRVAVRSPMRALLRNRA